MTWNPAQYLQYEDARLRPALELIARVPLAAPARIVDLGCGAGNVAQRLAQRWPDARIVGVDGDAAMLARARAATRGDARFAFVQADIGEWLPDAPVDLVFSNAALHWLDDHATLFPRLLAAVADGGALAVQMPDNFHAPSHVIVQQTACSPAWRARLGALVRPQPVAPLEAYFDRLAPHARRVDAWRTEYLQHLPRRDDGEHPVLAWLRGTTLLPCLAALDERAQRAFAADVGVLLAHAYPLRADGSVLFAFRRVFVIAAK